MVFDISAVSDIIREALFVVLKVGLPILLGSMVIGLIIAVFQAATQIHEQTLTFVPKLVIIILALILLGPWMAKEIMELFEYLFEIMRNVS